MTAQMKLLHNHPGSVSYQISQREAERLGVPVILRRQVVDTPPAPPALAPHEIAALLRDQKVRRMALEVHRAKQLGVRPTCHLITLKVALRTGLLYSDLKRESRVQDLVAARHRVFFGARVGAGKALTEIGKFFGLDHSTVHYGVKKHERVLRGDA